MSDAYDGKTRVSGPKKERGECPTWPWGHGCTLHAPASMHAALLKYANDASDTAMMIDASIC